MLSIWRPDRAVRRSVVVLILVSAVLVGAGTVLDNWLLLSIGVWALISGVAVELVYRP
ncbi:hypothetical protein [Streptomyces sp. NPDC005805]|uniref:hypothetical protein n=1 Tax=Streptomyces sp. NPDC005805 TaxID=3157068 RepID=UPI0033FB6CB0